MKEPTLGDTFKTELGDCFQVAGGFILDFHEEKEEYTLVHGIATGTSGNALGKRYVHAWIEVERVITWVIEKSNGNDICIPDVLYYAVGQIEQDTCRRYTKEEARILALDTGHWGPWDDFLFNFNEEATS